MCKKFYSFRRILMADRCGGSDQVPAKPATAAKHRAKLRRPTSQPTAVIDTTAGQDELHAISR